MLLQIKNYFTGERPPPPTRLHAMRSPRSRTESDSAVTSQSSGQIMKMSTSVDPFAPPKRKRNTNEWLERAKLVAAAARDRAVKMAQLREAPLMMRPPTVLQRRRLAQRLSAKS
jgi:hypothetical protein